MTDTRTGLELREAVARALGWAEHDWEWTGSPSPLMRAARCNDVMNQPGTMELHWCIPSDPEIRKFSIPHFESSLDACFGPGGPVEVMRKMDFSPDQSIQDIVTWRADAAMEFVDQWPLYLTAEDYCHAFLAAMEGADG